MGYTESQRRAIDARGAHVCVDAGAGSGKTRVLVDRVTALLDEDRDLSLHDIVAITFTRKAAYEMKERLRLAFDEKARNEAGRDGAFWRTQKRQLDAARITTIDSFCTQIIRDHAVLLGLDPEFRMMDEVEAQRLRIEVVTTTIESLLDAETSCAVESAVVYGVASLAQQLVVLLESSHCDRMLEEHDFSDDEALGAHWERLLAKAAESLYGRVSTSPRLVRLKRELEELDGLCTSPDDGREQQRVEYLRFIEGLQAAKGLNEIETVLESMTTFKPSRNGQRKNWGDGDYERIKKATDGAKRFASTHLIDRTPPDLDTVRLTRQTYELLERVSKAYGDVKRQSTLMDFGDLLSLVVRAFRSHAPILDDVKGTIRHLFIDEFQDTNDTQMEMVQHLVDFSKRDGIELFVVGDAKQSIYNFRGAEVNVFREIREASDVAIPLDDNFRSVPEVMDFVNDFFRRSSLLHGVEPEYRELRANIEAAEEIRTRFLVPEEKEGATTDDYRLAQAQLLARQLAAMVAGPEPVWVDADGEQRMARYGDVTVLFRTKSHMATYERALLDQGVPARILEGTGFYQQQEVADLRNLMKALLDPWDSHALLGYLRSPMAGLDDDTIFRLSTGHGLTHQFLSELDVGLQEETLARVREQFGRWQALTEGAVTGLLHAIVAESGIEAVLLNQPYGFQKASNLHKVFELAHQHDAAATDGLWGFLHRLDDAMRREVREGEAGLFEEEDGSVKLMTIHASKGLEFPIVVLAETASGAIPRARGSIRHHRRLGLACSYYVPDEKADRLFHSSYGKIIDQFIKNEEEDELARQLYVALTRARNWLLIVGAPRPRRGQGWENSWMSHFDRQYDLLSREDGDTIETDGVRASLIRSLGPASERKSSASKSVVEGPVDVSVIQRQIAPMPEPSLSESISVSDWLGSSDDETSETTVTADTIRAVERGTLVHRYFEDWTMPGPPPALEDWGRRAGCRDAEILETLRVASDRFASGPIFAESPADGQYLKEVPFQLRLGDGLVNGTIDLITPQGIIVDYKTGAMRGVGDHRYERQLQFYAHAARSLGLAISDVAYVFYLDELKWVEVNVEPSRCIDVVERETPT